MTLHRRKAREALGRALFEARETKGLGRQKLAVKLDVDTSTVHRWEDGVRPINIDRVADIAHYTDTTVGAIFARATELLAESARQRSRRASAQAGPQPQRPTKSPRKHPAKGN